MCREINCKTSQVPQPTCYCQLGKLTSLAVAIPNTSPRSFNALQTAHLFSFNLGTDVIGTCGKAVCQSIDFSSVNFSPQRPHTYSTAIMWGCYACGNVHRRGDRVTGGAEWRSSSILGTDNAPQQLLPRPFYCSISTFC